MSVIELDGARRAYMEIPYEDAAGIASLRIYYRTHCAISKSKEKLEAEMNLELDTIRAQLAQWHPSSILWWRTRPEITYDEKTKYYQYWSRLATSPEIMKEFWETLHIKREGKRAEEIV